MTDREEIDNADHLLKEAEKLIRKRTADAVKRLRAKRRQAGLCIDCQRPSKCWRCVQCRSKVGPPHYSL